jgi:hypothetical protein
MAWYHREDWQKLKAIFTDSQVLPPSYEIWLEKAESGFRRAKSRGMIVEKVYIDPDTFPAWCRSRGLNIDAQARTAFAGEVVARMYLHQGV